MKNELEFSRWLREKLKGQFGGAFHITSLQEIGEGCPDLLISHRSTGPFVAELKVIKSRQCIIPYRKAQPQWIADHVRNGGHVVIIVHIQEENSLAILYAQKVRETVDKKFSELAEDRHICEWLQDREGVTKWFVAHLVFFKAIYGWGRVNEADPQL